MKELIYQIFKFTWYDRYKCADYVFLTEGQMISPYGPSLLKKGSLFSCSSANIMIGRVKTKVFPDPVKAIPIMSLPERLQTNRVPLNVLKNRIYITAFVFYLYIHCWDSLYLNWCWVDDSLLFQTFQNCCRKNKHRSVVSWWSLWTMSQCFWCAGQTPLSPGGNFISLKLLIGAGMPSPSTRMWNFFLTRSCLVSGIFRM